MPDNESKLNTLDNTDTENNFRFPFSSLLTLALLCKTPVVNYAISAKITSSCIWVAIPVELFYIGMPLVWTDGRSGGLCTVT